ncbi:uridine diphosphate glucose pyrophosphatase NUDT22 [Lepisosteus oculatus]|uniref:uridine diphosphate glucose pyrophosphatase NUDT22 n=1 Tax=Lepisosteus oculatus TaxID=7918 RepID=UPI0035F50A00
MDPEVSILLHCAPCRGLREGQVQVELSPRYNRQSFPALEVRIAELWSQRVAREPWLFNGAKFRLHAASLRDRGDPGQAAPALSLLLGLTCYRDFLGTNWSAEAQALRSRGAAELGDPLAFLAQPLGVGGVVVTADGLVVFLRRSLKVGEAPGLIDIPGGHPEPKTVAPEVSEDSITVEQLCGRRVVRELFSSVLTEIRDEVNVPLACLSEPVLLGIALNHTSAGRPSAEFYIRCTLTSADVRELYWQGGPEAQESTNIVFIGREEVLRLDTSAPLWSELCPSAKGAVLLYQAVLRTGSDEDLRAPDCVHT